MDDETMEILRKLGSVMRQEMAPHAAKLVAEIRHLAEKYSLGNEQITTTISGANVQMAISMIIAGMISLDRKVVTVKPGHTIPAWKEAVDRGVKIGLKVNKGDARTPDNSAPKENG